MVIHLSNYSPSQSNQIRPVLSKSTTMKAVYYERYGGPEVLQIKEVSKPTPNDNEVLVKVSAVSINPYDWHYLQGTPHFMRLMTGLFSPKERILGNDVAGIVESVGNSVTTFKEGDAVFGSPKLGGLAEYVCIPSERLVHKPDSVSMAEASSSIIAGGTALVGTREFGDIKEGDKVLINAASGGVGSFAVQLAKYFGGEVTAVCSAGNHDLVKSIGATHAIDYKTQPIDSWNGPYDVVMDVMGNLTLSDFRKLVKPGGTVVVIGYTKFSLMMSIMLRKKVGAADLKVVQFDSADVLPDLVNLMKDNAFRSVIDRTYPVDQIQEAMTYLLSMHAKGKVVISFEQ